MASLYPVTSRVENVYLGPYVNYVIQNGEHQIFRVFIARYFVISLIHEPPGDQLLISKTAAVVVYHHYAKADMSWAICRCFMVTGSSTCTVSTRTCHSLTSASKLWQSPWRGNGMGFTGFGDIAWDF